MPARRRCRRACLPSRRYAAMSYAALAAPCARRYLRHDILLLIYVAPYVDADVHDDARAASVYSLFRWHDAAPRHALPDILRRDAAATLCVTPLRDSAPCLSDAPDARQRVDARCRFIRCATLMRDACAMRATRERVCCHRRSSDFHVRPSD